MARGLHETQRSASPSLCEWLQECGHDGNMNFLCATCLQMIMKHHFLHESGMTTDQSCRWLDQACICMMCLYKMHCEDICCHCWHPNTWPVSEQPAGPCRSWLTSGPAPHGVMLRRGSFLCRACPSVQMVMLCRPGSACMQPCSQS